METKARRHSVIAEIIVKMSLERNSEEMSAKVYADDSVVLVEIEIKILLQDACTELKKIKKIDN